MQIVDVTVIQRTLIHIIHLIAEFSQRYRTFCFCFSHTYNYSEESITQCLAILCWLHLALYSLLQQSSSGMCHDSCRGRPCIMIISRDEIILVDRPEGLQKQRNTNIIIIMGKQILKHFQSPVCVPQSHLNYYVHKQYTYLNDCPVTSHWRQTLCQTQRQTTRKTNYHKSHYLTFNSFRRFRKIDHNNRKHLCFIWVS